MESILYVDDDADSRHAFGWLFRNAGFDVREAATGTEALRLARHRPDLVVLDVNLPDINGFDVCREIKSHPATASIPILHLSACFISSEDRAQGLEAGADGYLTKPIEPGELLAQVKAALRSHRAEVAARSSVRGWHTLFDALNAGVCLLDAGGQVLRCNQAMAQLLGKPFRAIIGESCERLVQEVGGAKDIPLLARARDLHRGEAQEIRLADRWYLVTADPAHDEGGELARSVHLFIDFTDWKRVEERRGQEDKLEAVSRLAGGIAHDFNNLLTVITGNASLVLASLSADDPRRDSLSMIEKAAWRCAEIARQLLGFSRQTLLWFAPTDLNRCLHELVDPLRRTIHPRIALEIHTAPGLWTVLADSAAMYHVLMSLCLNAHEAMPKGGQLSLESANVTRGEAKGVPTEDAGTGDFVRLRVLDTGRGIAPDVLPHIFEPFVTTKDVGQGTGLSLAMAFGVVKQHRGWIECTSAVNEGTCFDIYLPRAGCGNGLTSAGASPA
jgi:signal transduction histidine kinase